MKNLLAFLIISIVISGCTFNVSTLENKNHSMELMQHFFNQNFDDAIKYFDASEIPDSIMDSTIADFKVTLHNILQAIANDFGDTVEFQYINSSQEFLNDSTANISTVRIQIKNEEYYGQVQLDYNNENDLVKTIRYVDLKEEIPSFTQFWMLGIYPLLLLLFQIWLIIKILKSNIKRKWLIIIPIVLLNYPTVVIHYMHTVFLDSAFQVLLGIGLEYDGYSFLTWNIGFPIGSIIILMLYRKRILKKHNPNKV